MNAIGHNHLIDLNSRVSAIRDELLAIESVTGENSGVVKDKIAKAKEIAKEIEEARKAAKEPHLEAGRQIDAAFNPLKDKITDAWSGPSKMLEAWMIAERKRAEEVAREAARLAAEKAEREKAITEFVGEQSEDVAALNTAAAKAKKLAEEAGRVQSASGEGRATGLKTVRTAKVTDAKALVVHYFEHPDVLGAATKLANAAIRAAKGGPISIPGVEVQEEQRLA